MARIKGDHLAILLDLWRNSLKNTPLDTAATAEEHDYFGGHATFVHQDTIIPMLLVMSELETLGGEGEFESLIPYVRHLKYSPTSLKDLVYELSRMEAGEEPRDGPNTRSASEWVDSINASVAACATAMAATAAAVATAAGETALQEQNQQVEVAVGGEAPQQEEQAVDVYLVEEPRPFAAAAAVDDDGEVEAAIDDADDIVVVVENDDHDGLDENGNDIGLPAASAATSSMSLSSFFFWRCCWRHHGDADDGGGVEADGLAAEDDAGEDIRNVGDNNNIIYLQDADEIVRRCYHTMDATVEDIRQEFQTSIEAIQQRMWDTVADINQHTQAAVEILKQQDIESRERNRVAFVVIERASRDMRETNQRASRDMRETNQRATLDIKEANQRASRDIKEANQRASRNIAETNQQAMRDIKEANQRSDRYIVETIAWRNRMRVNLQVVVEKLRLTEQTVEQHRDTIQSLQTSMEDLTTSHGDTHGSREDEEQYSHFGM